MYEEDVDDLGNPWPHDLGEESFDDYRDEDDDSIVPGAPPAPEPEIEIPDQLQAETAFLCGPAGTGKTFMSLAMAKQLPGTVLAASTGIAACNLGEGVTINSLLKYFNTESLVESYTIGKLTAILGRLSKIGVQRIILDEVSMVDAEQLTVITRALDELRPDSQNEPVDVETFSGKKHKEISPIDLLLVGDFCQLPPVKAPFAFESPEWARYYQHLHTLTTIRRQADAEFIQAIQAARAADVGTMLQYFGPRLTPAQDNSFDGTTIFAKNDSVDRFNQLRLDKVDAKVAEYPAERWGVEPGDWKNIPPVLTLKEGALVMLLANKREKSTLMGARLIYANGDLGVVKHAPPGKAIVVTLKRTGQDVQVEYLERQHLIPLESGRTAALKAQGKSHLIVEGKKEIIGTIAYLPVRLAYGTTVHKSQGLSLDRVQVNTNEGMFKQPGLLYVALSRARTADGLRLIGFRDGLAKRCMVHPKVRPWL